MSDQKKAVDSPNASPSPLPSLAAGSEAPQWLTVGTDEERWDGLFAASEGAASEDVSAAPSPLPSFKAEGDAPQWLAGPTEPERWDGLFESWTAQASKTESASTADAASATDSAAADIDAADIDAADTEQPAETNVPETAASETKEPASAQPVGGPYGLPPAGTEPHAGASTPGSRSRSSRSGAGRKRSPLKLVWLALALAALAVVAIVVVTNLVRQADTAAEPETARSPNQRVLPTTAGADGVIEENVSPFDLTEGQCLLDFKDVTRSVTVVTCETPHSAQLVASHIYPDSDPFPGRDALTAKADELCNNIEFNDNVSKYQKLQKIEAHPTETTWANGDRRVDCIVFSEEGNVITDSLVN